MKMRRPSSKIDPTSPGSDLAASVAAAYASGAALFGERDPNFAQKLLGHARQLLTFAMRFKGKYSDSVPAAREFYRSWSGYNDEVVFAAAWIARASATLRSASVDYDLAKAKSIALEYPIGRENFIHFSARLKV